MQVRDVFTFFFFCYYSVCLFFAFGKKRGTKHVTQSFDCSIAIAHEIVHTTTSTTTSPRSRPTWSGRWGRGAMGEIASDFWQNKTRSQTLDSGDAAERRALMM